MYRIRKIKEDKDKQSMKATNKYEHNEKQNPSETVDQETIVIHGDGSFPKTIVIIENDRTKKYLLRKTRKGKYLLN